MFERTLTSWFGDPYSFGEAKRILKAFGQFADLHADGDKVIQRAKRKQFLEEVHVAADRLQSDVEARVHTMLTDREAVGNKTMSEQLHALDDPFYEPADERIVPTRRNYLHRYWRILGESRTPRWRETLKQLQTGKISLRKALQEMDAPALGVEERRDEAPGAGASHARPTPDPEVVAKPKRRKFTAQYRLRILEEAESCTQPGEVGRLLRREGLYPVRPFVTYYALE